MPDQPTIVAAIVTSPQGVLLARRHDGKPEWTFPSGAQEVGEVYADTAVRETLEETGLAVSPAIRSEKELTPQPGGTWSTSLLTPSTVLRCGSATPTSTPKSAGTPGPRPKECSHTCSSR